VEALVARYVAAWNSGDPSALVALLKEEVTLTMPPSPLWLRGRAAVNTFLPDLLGRVGAFTVRRIEVSGGPGMAGWARAPGQATASAYAIQSFTVEGGGISSISVFMRPDLFARFGLPTEI